MIQWIYETIYTAVGEMFSDINNLGVEIFDLSWVQAVVNLFTLLGWMLFVVGVVVAVFEVAMECQTGRVSIKGAALNVLKGFFAASLVGVLPVQLYKLCCSLQGIFTGDLAGIFAAEQSSSIGEFAANVLSLAFMPTQGTMVGLKSICILIAFSYDSEFFKLVEDSAMLTDGISTTAIGLRDTFREFYMNFVSLSGGESWNAKKLIGSFQLEVIGTSGVTKITNQDYLVSTADGKDSYAATCQDVTIILTTDCTVTFETNGGSEIPDLVAQYGETIARPDNPVREGYRLVGWYTDIDLKNPWDFDTDTVQGNMTLYAKWEVGTPVDETPGNEGDSGFAWWWLLLILFLLGLLIFLLIFMLNKKTVIDARFGAGTGLATLWRCLYRNGLTKSTGSGGTFGEMDYVATKDTYYHIADDFKLEDVANSTITVDFANTGDWLNSLSFGNAESGTKKGNIPLTTQFSPENHHYQAVMIDKDNLVFTWLTTSASETNLNVEAM